MLPLCDSFLFQLAMFQVAKSYVDGLFLTSSPGYDLEEMKNIRFRMMANAFFTTYGQVYDRYV